MSIKNQKGFGLVDMLVVVVVLGLIGGAGYFVYKKNQKPVTQTASKVVEQSKTPSTTKASSPKIENNIKTNDKSYAAEGETYKFSMKYPSSWAIDELNNPKTSFENMKVKLSDENGNSVRISKPVGLGGMCEPARDDVAFGVNNQCASYVSLSEKDQSNGKLLTARVRQPKSSIDQYNYCFYPKGDNISSGQLPKVNNPVMGLGYPCYGATIWIEFLDKIGESPTVFDSTFGKQINSVIGTFEYSLKN